MRRKRWWETWWAEGIFELLLSILMNVIEWAIYALFL